MRQTQFFLHMPFLQPAACSRIHGCKVVRKERKRSDAWEMDPRCAAARGKERLPKSRPRFKWLASSSAAVRLTFGKGEKEVQDISSIVCVGGWHDFLRETGKMSGIFNLFPWNPRRKTQRRMWKFSEFPCGRPLRRRPPGGFLDPQTTAPAPGHHQDT